MRARLTLIPTIAAVLLAVAPVAPAGAHTAPSSGAGWFATASVGTSQVELVARLRANQRARLAAVAKVLTTPPPAPVAPPVEDPTSFIWPAKAPITSYFGRRWGRAHTGVDIDAAYGAPIVAAQAGTVTLAGWKNGYGNTVIIDHGHGISTLYGHQSKLVVRTGQHVDQGQQIGNVGATGHVTAAHLHYEVLLGGVPRNPMPWL
jgi:murein DD-endopeptidase MepM/ murein hydrolase activator NlpD